MGQWAVCFSEQRRQPVSRAAAWSRHGVCVGPVDWLTVIFTHWREFMKDSHCLTTIGPSLSDSVSPLFFSSLPQFIPLCYAVAPHFLNCVGPQATERLGHLIWTPFHSLPHPCPPFPALTVLVFGATFHLLGVASLKQHFTAVHHHKICIYRRFFLLNTRKGSICHCWLKSNWSLIG